MTKQEQLEKILLNAKRSKKIDISLIDNLRLSEEEMEKVISFFIENGIKDILDEKNDKILAENENEYFSGDSLKMYLNEISMYKLLTPEEEKNLFKLYNQGDKTAKTKLINANLRLVIKPAKTFYYTAIKSASVDLLDTIQLGNLGLMKAVDKFDVNKGYKFSSYALWWIKQSIKRNVNENKNTIRIPTHMGEFIRKLRKFEHEFLIKNQRMPQLKEYVEQLNEKEDNIKLALQTDRELISLDVPVGEDDTPLEFFVSDSKNEYNLIDNKILVEQIIRMVSPKLKDMEKNVLMLRYGLFGNTMHTLEEISQKYNLSRERVRQIEMNLLRKIRITLEQQNIMGKIR